MIFDDFWAILMIAKKLISLGNILLLGFEIRKTTKNTRKTIKMQDLFNEFNELRNENEEFRAEVCRNIELLNEREKIHAQMRNLMENIEEILRIRQQKYALKKFAERFDEEFIENFMPSFLEDIYSRRDRISASRFSRNSVCRKSKSQVVFSKNEIYCTLDQFHDDALKIEISKRIWRLLSGKFEKSLNSELIYGDYVIVQCENYIVDCKECESLCVGYAIGDDYHCCGCTKKAKLEYKLIEIIPNKYV